MESNESSVLSREEEKELVRRAATDQEAFGELYSINVRRIYSYIYYRVGNHQNTQDLTAKVFHRALKNIHKYEDRGIPFSAWLYRIAHNLVANFHRDQNRRQTVSYDNITIPGYRNHPERETIEREEREILLEAVQLLPPERQELLILKFINHLSNAEIGEIMGRTEGAVKSLYHRTLVSLRKEMVRVDENLGEKSTDE
ncbi:MAG: sigma-70 family RNA polymerase sigma factor [Anaerolineales bacterium]|nr:sigma-70 family RNA polymerase sigma factor [Anaerolineales bacterium]